MEVLLPEKLVPVFTEPARYRGAYGGRGSAKSATFAKMAAIQGMRKRSRILCAREFQNSIKDSSQAEIIAAIEGCPKLSRFYTIGESFIRGRNGTEFLFKGLRRNYKEIKSYTNINICWAEEAEAISEASWATLIPTIRAPGSEIWLTWNPEQPDSATHKRFIENPPERSRIVQMNWRDNPWFPPELDEERRRDFQLNPDTYPHIWEGECLTRTDAQILGGKWIVEEFEPTPEWGDPLHGLDFGFAQDPTAGVRVWVHDGCLYVEHEAGKVNLELDDTAGYMSRHIPGFEKYVIRADCARPESISHLKSHGLPKIIPCEKWSGSVEDGIAHLRTYKKIVIHPRCKEVIKEARLYSYKLDRNTGDVLPSIVDAYNHYIDAIRYALGPMIKRKGKSFFAR